MTHMCLDDVNAGLMDLLMDLEVRSLVLRLAFTSWLHHVSAASFVVMHLEAIRAMKRVLASWWACIR